MFYKFIQLKDLPDTPAGTVFRCLGIKGFPVSVDGNAFRSHYQIEVGGDIKYYPVGKSVFDNPEWFRKEIDIERLTDLRCPSCGETRGVFVSGSAYDRDPSSNCYGLNIKFGFECVCGFMRPFLP